MMCPYYGLPCNCTGQCRLDIKRRDVSSGRLIVVKLGEFHCVCGSKIETPVSPCHTAGCNYKGTRKPPFRKVTAVKDIKIVTLERPDRTFQTTVQGGKLCGKQWFDETLHDALDQHDGTIALVRML